MRVMKCRIWIPEAPYLLSKSGMYYQDSQYLSSFLRRVYTQFGVNHPSAMPFQIEERLMWATGLRDIKDRDIYEGDIVSCDQAQGLGFKIVGIVHFGIDYRDSSGWCDPRIYLDTRPFEEYGSKFCIFHLQPEVVGNIYENPELASQN